MPCPHARCAFSSLVAAAALLAPACHEHGRHAFDDSDPSIRLNAVHKACSDRDQSSVPDLIRALDSDDPAERMLANHALEELTGQSFNYDHAAARPVRDAAAERWASWYASQPHPSPSAAPRN